MKSLVRSEKPPLPPTLGSRVQWLLLLEGGREGEREGKRRTMRQVRECGKGWKTILPAVKPISTSTALPSSPAWS